VSREKSNIFADNVMSQVIGNNGVTAQLQVAGPGAAGSKPAVDPTTIPGGMTVLQMLNEVRTRGNPNDRRAFDERVFNYQQAYAGGAGAGAAAANPANPVNSNPVNPGGL